MECWEKPQEKGKHGSTVSFSFSPEVHKECDHQKAQENYVGELYMDIGITVSLNDSRIIILKIIPQISFLPFLHDSNSQS